jgi:NitT/TauT family transport system substrate-binding protein
MTMAMRMRTLAAAGAAALLLAATFAASGQDAKPEVSRVRLAVGGKPALFYLPLTVTERLGYFRDAGLDVEISDFPGGARALQALIGGSADVVTGSFDHTIQMQAKGQPTSPWCSLANSPATCSAC